MRLLPILLVQPDTLPGVGFRTIPTTIYRAGTKAHIAQRIALDRQRHERATGRLHTIANSMTDKMQSTCVGNHATVFSCLNSLLRPATIVP